MEKQKHSRLYCCTAREKLKALKSKAFYFIAKSIKWELVAASSQTKSIKTKSILLHRRINKTGASRY